MSEISSFRAMMDCRCPRCRKGRMFTNSGFNLRYGRRLYQNCPVCQLRFEREPAFFEGAMYFNYAMNVALMVASGVATYVLLDDPGGWVYFGNSAALVVLMVSFTSRLSKSMMLHFFGGVDYDPGSVSQASEKM
jgi:uncharacterized protein (DUF983 family)